MDISTFDIYVVRYLCIRHLRRSIFMYSTFTFSTFRLRHLRFRHFDIRHLRRSIFTFSTFTTCVCFMHRTSCIQKTSIRDILSGIQNISRIPDNLVFHITDVSHNCRGLYTGHFGRYARLWYVNFWHTIQSCLVYRTEPSAGVRGLLVTGRPVYVVLV